MTSVKPIPLAVFEAAVRVAGESLYWKDSLKRLMRSCGVSENGHARYAALTKYQIFRSVWGDLDNAGVRGLKVQHNLIEALANLDSPDPKVPDRRAGQRAIDDLRRLAADEELLVSPADLRRDRLKAEAAEMADRVSAKENQLKELQGDFIALHQQSDHQNRGYALERLLAGLFRLNELEYTGSYRTETDQVDGAVTLDAFTYLVEAKWCQAAIADSEIGAFNHKIERRIDATRGLFISMSGFRKETLDLFRRAKDNRLIFVDGADLAWILEGRMDLAEVLRGKVRAASIQGEPFVRAAEL